MDISFWTIVWAIVVAVLILSFWWVIPLLLGGLIQAIWFVLSLVAEWFSGLPDQIRTEVMGKNLMRISLPGRQPIYVDVSKTYACPIGAFAPIIREYIKDSGDTGNMIDLYLCANRISGIGKQDKDGHVYVVQKNLISMYIQEGHVLNTTTRHYLRPYSVGKASLGRYAR